MRTVTIKLGGEEFELSRSFETLEKITAQVVDPLWLAEEGFRAEKASASGKAYKPAYTLTFADACRILHIAHIGDTSVDAIKARAFDTGALVVREVVIMFLTALVTPPNPEKIKADAKEGAEKGE